MEPIISPWLIYAISISDSIKDAFNVFTIIIFIGGIIVACILTFADELEWVSENKTTTIKGTIGWFVFFIIFGLLSILTPSKNTLIGMIVADQITYDNVSKGVDAGKNLKNELKKDVLDIIEAITKEKKEMK